MSFIHEAVLVSEVLNYLPLNQEGLYIDCTLGGGGHAEALLGRLPAGAWLLGIDQDTNALQAAARRLDPYAQRLRLIHGNFRRLEEIWRACTDQEPVGILFDLGVSSPQLDDAQRGFSYQEDAPLDMRMDQQQDLSAYDIVNSWSQKDLAVIIKRYGEERWADRIAEFIVRFRQQAPILTTDQLVDVIKAAIPAGARRRGPHPARRTFQALRIAVNDELGTLSAGLDQAARIVAPGGHVVVISFHSLEDRIVKHFFRELSMTGEFELLTKKPVIPSDEEITNNPRSRSSKLRAIRRKTTVLSGEGGA